MHTLKDFKLSLEQPTPPETTPALSALWHDGKGDWEMAHEIAQEIDTEEGAWIHAYLHRKEGDDGNALYWYQRARKQLPTVSLQSEWDEIVTTLLLKK